MTVGIDLVEVARLRRIVERHAGFRERTFTPTELVSAEALPERRRFEFLAGRFAVKEAVLKAFGTGLSDEVAFTDIEVAVAESGAPLLRLTGGAQRLAAARGLTRFQTSISHDAGIAVAVVALI